MTNTWQITYPRAKKTHIYFFLQHLILQKFQIFSPFVFLSLSLSNISFFSSLFLTLLSLHHQNYHLEPFSQFHILQNYSPYLFRSVKDFNVALIPMKEKIWFWVVIMLMVVDGCKHKIFQLQKIKQLKRNMVCKYKFVLMYYEYNLYFNSFTTKYPLILSSLNLTRTRNLFDFSWKMDWTISITNL